MGKLKDVSFIFLIKRENVLQALLPVGKLFPCSHSIPSAAARSFCNSVSFLCFSLFFLLPHPFPPFCPEARTGKRVGGGGGGQRAHPGSVWGGLLIQACCRHPALRICRYLIKPGIPGGFEKPSGGQWALSPHLILTSAVIIPRCWQEEAESLSFPAPSS